ncbi:MAG: hypothetical protein AB7F08_00905 [Dongiaceae bacterium]
MNRRDFIAGIVGGLIVGGGIGFGVGKGKAREAASTVAGNAPTPPSATDCPPAGPEVPTEP